MIKKIARINIVLILFLAAYSLSNAQAQNNQNFAESKKQVLDQTFISDRECYFSFEFKSKEQLNQLSKIISIDKTENNSAFAYASRNDFEKFLNLNISYQLLSPPLANFQADMFDSRLKKTYAWDQYLSYSDYVNLMYQFAIDHPSICQVFSIGQSIEGREILVAKISDHINEKEAEPQFLYTGQIHGDELVASILMLRLIDVLTSNYGSDNQVNQLVDNIEIWINPLANPDGLYAGGDNTVNGAKRTNANAVDLNRNFPDPEDGDHPDGKNWQKETQLFMDLAEAQNFTMSANTHSGSEVVNYPWDTWIRRNADDDWWQMVSHEYADFAQQNSPSGYMAGFDDGISNGYDWYRITGGRQDYMNYFQHCREVTIEQSTLKFVPANELPNYWNYNRQTMLNYLEQVTYGFRGKVTDLETNDPIKAKIEIEGHDFDNSFVFSNANGEYYRPIKAGTYTLIFSAEGYDSIKVSNQLIADFDSKIVNIGLQKTDTGIDSDLLSKIQIINPVQNHHLKIISPLEIKAIKIYNILGQLVYTENTNDKEIQIEMNNIQSGVYIVELDLVNGESFKQRIISR